jgi:23S rRNA (adenine2503-C2)-methyltransferase
MLSSIYGIDPGKLESFIGDYFPAYRCRQLLKWIYGKKVFDPALMTDLPDDFKEFVSRSFDLGLPEIRQKLVSTDGSIKYRLVLKDGKQIEMVLMPEGKKLTLCVSSQTGCARGCLFCATGSMKPARNLESHDIIGQILLASHLSDSKITNIVFMGMGEPFDNLDNVLDAIRHIQLQDTLAFSPRRITLSTCGIIPGIHKLADSGIKVKLALSLNSANNETRDELMPVNKLYPLPALKKALQYYQTKSPFRITLEYILIPEVNMGYNDLKALKRFSGDLSCKINFIPYNPVSSLSYRAPEAKEIEDFMRLAADLPQAIMLRRSKGADINGACGQLVVRSQIHNKEQQ